MLKGSVDVGIGMGMGMGRARVMRECVRRRGMRLFDMMCDVMMMGLFGKSVVGL